jgi:hypothetical protein
MLTRMSWFLGVIGLRGGSARRAFAEVRLATESDLPKPPPPLPAAPAVAAAAQEARAAAALSAVLGKKR